jgi:hypothetical protein
MPANDPVPQYRGFDPVETGMGPGRAEKLLKFAADQARGRRLAEQAA